MNNLLRCREIESLCRQRAVSDRAHHWKWLDEADRWNDLAHRGVAVLKLQRGPNPFEVATQDLDQAWNSVHDAFKAQIILQLGADSLFDAPVSYNPYTGAIDGTPHPPRHN